jgi:hypothetical protein
MALFDSIIRADVGGVGLDGRAWGLKLLKGERMGGRKIV